MGVRSSWEKCGVWFRAFLTRDTATHFPIFVVTATKDNHTEAIPAIVPEEWQSGPARAWVAHVEPQLLDRFDTTQPDSTQPQSSQFRSAQQRIS